MSHFDPVEISAVLREQGFCEQDDLGLGQNCGPQSKPRDQVAH
jgi:hypothetical protein